MKAWAIIALILLTATAAVAQPSAHQVVVINFNSEVDLGSRSLFQQAISYAISSKASAIVIYMNSPGGYLSDMLSIISFITKANQSGIPVYTYVPQNGLAASAASYIAMATNKIIMGPGSEIGPSTPIVVGGTPLEENHTESAMLSLMASEASEWGRNVTAASEMVLDDRAFSASEAYRYGLISGTADNLTAALNMLGLSGYSVVYFSENTYDQFLSVLSNSTVDGLLMLLGFILIALDILHPTFLLSAVGIVLIVLGFVGAELIGASAIGYVLLLISAVLIFLELKTGHGFSFLAGVIVGVVGIYMLGSGLVVSPTPYGIAYVAESTGVIGAGSGLAVYIRAILGRRRRALTGKESLIGTRGTVVKDLKPCGEVRIEGVVWRACIKEGVAKKGEQVTVESMDGLTLIVKKP